MLLGAGGAHLIAPEAGNVSRIGYFGLKKDLNALNVEKPALSRDDVAFWSDRLRRGAVTRDVVTGVSERHQRPVGGGGREGPRMDHASRGCGWGV